MASDAEVVFGGKPLVRGKPVARCGIDVLLRRIRYGGKKGRSAMRRLKRGVAYGHPSGGYIQFKLRSKSRVTVNGEDCGFAVVMEAPLQPRGHMVGERAIVTDFSMTIPVGG